MRLLLINLRTKRYVKLPFTGVLPAASNSRKPGGHKRWCRVEEAAHPMTIKALVAGRLGVLSARYGRSDIVEVPAGWDMDETLSWLRDGCPRPQALAEEGPVEEMPVLTDDVPEAVIPEKPEEEAVVSLPETSPEPVVPETADEPAPAEEPPSDPEPASAASEVPVEEPADEPADEPEELADVTPESLVPVESSPEVPPAQEETDDGEDTPDAPSSDEPELVLPALYAREELEAIGYRDLQKLAKQHEDVPANQSSEELIDQLAALTASPE